jgi:hypothetical protein
MVSHEAPEIFAISRPYGSVPIMCSQNHTQGPTEGRASVDLSAIERGVGGSRLGYLTRILSMREACPALNSDSQWSSCNVHGRWIVGLESRSSNSALSVNSKALTSVLPLREMILSPRLSNQFILKRDLGSDGVI